MRRSLASALVFRVLLGQPAAQYGLQISRRSGIRSGTLYPMLARLERLGVVASAWEPIDPRQAGRPARKYYRLTPAGAAYARRVLADLGLEPLKPALTSGRPEHRQYRRRCEAPVCETRLLAAIRGSGPESGYGP
jgi:PadR family transcriptional regulator, regulatory protein PadR